MPDSYKEDGRPSQQWYWDDWFAEFGLRLCSLEARGLWMDMLGIMFKAEIRGTLTVNGKQLNNKALTKIVGSNEQKVNKCLIELEENDVFSRLEDDTIISRRMYRESQRKEEISRIRAEAGKKGMDKRWQKDSKANNKKITKITASSSISSPFPISSSNKDNISKDIYVNKWNKFAKENNLTKIEEILSNSKRESHLKARLKNKKFNFDTLLEKIKNQPFLLGKNKDGWTVTFDWILLPSNYQKIIEESYKNRKDKFSGLKDFYEDEKRRIENESK